MKLNCVAWKVIIALPLLYLLFLTLFCPCKRVLCCHLWETWLAVGVLILVILAANNFKLIDGSCKK